LKPSIYVAAIWQVSKVNFFRRPDIIWGAGKSPKKCEKFRCLFAKKLGKSPKLCAGEIRKNHYCSLNLAHGWNHTNLNGIS
jgi:hypothetical protein